MRNRRLDVAYAFLRAVSPFVGDIAWDHRIRPRREKSAFGPAMPRLSWKEGATPSITGGKP